MAFDDWIAPAADAFFLCDANQIIRDVLLNDSVLMMNNWMSIYVTDWQGVAFSNDEAAFTVGWHRLFFSLSAMPVVAMAVDETMQCGRQFKADGTMLRRQKNYKSGQIMAAQGGDLKSEWKSPNHPGRSSVTKSFLGNFKLS